MKLQRLREVQMEEIMQWADDVDSILTPDNLNPTKIKDYPSTIEASERLKRICKHMSDELKTQLQRIEDVIMDNIENAEFAYKHDRAGMPVMKKKYDTADKRKRELRLRLHDNEEYTALALEQKQWAMMYSDWVSHVNRLRRDLDLLEVNYQSNGGDGYDI